jgi:hypothetical protein
MERWNDGKNVRDGQIIFPSFHLSIFPYINHFLPRTIGLPTEK